MAGGVEVKMQLRPESQVNAYVEALEAIWRWAEFPPASCNGVPTSYKFAHGLSGERDHMRRLARPLGRTGCRKSGRRRTCKRRLIV